MTTLTFIGLLTLHWNWGFGTPSASQVRTVSLPSAARYLVRLVIRGFPETHYFSFLHYYLWHQTMQHNWIYKILQHIVFFFQTTKLNIVELLCPCKSYSEGASGIKFKRIYERSLKAISSVTITSTVDWDRTTNPPFSRWPALIPELQRPQYCVLKYEAKWSCQVSMCVKTAFFLTFYD